MSQKLWCAECQDDIEKDPNGKPWRYSVDLVCGHTVNAPIEEWD